MLVCSLSLAGGVLKVCYLLVVGSNPFCCDFHGQCSEWAGVRPAVDETQTATLSSVIFAATLEIR